MEGVRRLLRKFKIVYEFAGVVSAYLVEASSKYDAKQRFYRVYPRAKIIKIEPVGNEYEEDS